MLRFAGDKMLPKHHAILSELQQFARQEPAGRSNMQHVAECLYEEIAYYNRVGFYLLDPNESEF